MSATVAVAGIRFILPFSEDVHRDDFSDLDVEVAWIDSDDPPQGIVLDAPGGLEVVIDADLPRVWLPLVEQPPGAGYWQLRQVAPIVAAWHRRLTLHASAVVVDDGAFLFVGGSGVGKSTLVWALSKEGAYPAADDLAPIRFTDDGAIIHSDGRSIPIRSIAFLNRSDGEPSLTAIAPADALARHLTDGFGEHGNPDVWAFQFDAYSRLVAAVPHHGLSITDDRTRIQATAAWLMAELQHTTEAI